MIDFIIKHVLCFPFVSLSFLVLAIVSHPDVEQCSTNVSAALFICSWSNGLLRSFEWSLKLMQDKQCYRNC